MDRLSLVPRDRVTWPNGPGFRPIAVHVNDRPLIDIVREIERPYAEAEWDRRVAAGEAPDDIGPRGGIAGTYLYLGAPFLGRSLRGEPYKAGFVLEGNDPRRSKSLFLQCTCGITDCWFLLARVSLTDERVVWSDFCQFHRDWHYDLRFEFDRAAYERTLLAAGPA